MEIYKPSKLALQNTFFVCGMQFNYAEDFKQINAVKVAFNRRAFNAQVEMTECYEKQINSMEHLLTKGVSIMERINRESAEFAVSVLMHYGIEWVTPDALTTFHPEYSEVSRDGRKNYYHINWEITLKDLVETSLKPIRVKVKQVTDFQQELSYQRQVQRASRGSWQGGGFGFKGAIKGAMMAGMMNAGTSVFRGIGDSFVNAKDAGRVQSLKNSIVDGDMPLSNFNYIVRTYVHHLFEITKGYLLNSFSTSSKYSYDNGTPKIKCRINRKDIEEAIGKFQNYELFYKNGSKTADEVKMAIFEYMLTNIWDINAYRSLYLLCDKAADKKSIIEITAYLGLQYEFANIALNIDEDLIEEAEENKVAEVKLNRIRKEVGERAQLIDFLLSSDDEQIERNFLKQTYINKNGIYVEKASVGSTLDNFTQEDFKIMKSDLLETELPFLLSFRENPYNGEIKLHGSNFVYEGTFKEGKITGSGNCEYTNGNTFKGEFVNGQLINGKIITESETYEGGVRFDKDGGISRYHGKGRITFTTGAIIEGEFVNDQLNGYCKITYVSGNVFEGNVINNTKEGNCKFTTKEYIFNGKCVGGKMVSGTVTYINGSSYTGEIDNEKGLGYEWCKSGEGIYAYTDGQSYEGGWRNDMRHGHGTLKDKAGAIIYQGEWGNDARKTGGLFSKLKDKFRGL